MSAPCVVFDHVSKRFERGERHDSLRDLVPAAFGGLFRPRARDTFWAVRDVSFEVARGEAFGIIGQNGAGKSTVLKLLTRLLEPTHGTCRVTGQIGALIEVAAGFHPDLTGRENIFLQGAILGMGRRHLAARLDSIVDFAGIGPFLDTPVKRYSSGMNARLGFSIAAHLDPDVLIIDEVLSVGDLAFRQKCQARMREFLNQGVAIVFVSHDLPSVLKLCDRAMLLHHGEVLGSGTAREVVAQYSTHALGSPTFDGATMQVTVEEPGIDGPAWTLNAGSPITFSADIEFHTGADAAAITIDVFDLVHDTTVYSATSTSLGLPTLRVRPGERHTFDLALTAHLTDGLYTLKVTTVDQATSVPLSTPWRRRINMIDTQSLQGPANLRLRIRHRVDHPPSADTSRTRSACMAGGME
jgi:ABC-type polysaccharide/polyol phosphate transport system ATPase subunit